MLEIEGPVAVAGDWHDNRSYAQAAIGYVKETHPYVKALIQLGDLCFYHPNSLDMIERTLQDTEQMLYWIEGNHENHPLVRSLKPDEDGLGFVSPHIRHIPRVTEFHVNKRKWIALGGAFTMHRNKRPVGFELWQEGEAITLEQARAATAYEWCDVLITHDAPLGIPVLEQAIIDADLSRYPEWEVVAGTEQRRIVREVDEVLQPTTHYHGHHHRYHRTSLVLDSGHVTNVIGLARDGAPFHENIIITQ